MTVTLSEREEFFLPPLLRRALSEITGPLEVPGERRVQETVMAFARCVGTPKKDHYDLLREAIKYTAWLSLFRGARSRYLPGGTRRRFTISAWGGESFELFLPVGDRKSTEGPLSRTERYREMVFKVLGARCQEAGVNTAGLWFGFLNTNGMMGDAKAIVTVAGSGKQVFAIYAPRNYLHVVAKFPVLPGWVPIYHDPESRDPQLRENVIYFDEMGRYHVRPVDHDSSRRTAPIPGAHHPGGV